jgi:hypothetical protein
VQALLRGGDEGGREGGREGDTLSHPTYNLTKRDAIYAKERKMQGGREAGRQAGRQGGKGGRGVAEGGKGDGGWRGWGPLCLILHVIWYNIVHYKM